MVNEEHIQQIIDIISKEVLTNMIYMIEHNNRVDFIYMTQDTIDDIALTNTQRQIRALLAREVELLDMKLFDEVDRLDIMKKATLIYCESPTTQKIFEMSSVNDIKNMIENKRVLINRKKECNTFYLQ